MANILASLDEDHFKVLAYRKAAKVLADYPVDVAEAYKKGGIKALTAIPGIGAALSKKIAEFIETGRMKKYDEVMAQKPQENRDEVPCRKRHPRIYISTKEVGD